ncbi:MAG: pyridoxal 5'-phosphate synthase glutaminase subunit PdxT [Myxococcota bacterium]
MSPDRQPRLGARRRRGHHRVGILAIQGDVDAHREALAAVGAEGLPVLKEKQLDGLDALILPGGESTTISKGLDRLGLYEPIGSFAASGRPVLGTCAGAILVARAAAHHPVQTLGLIDLVAHRNAYGTQVDSFATSADSGTAPGFVGLRCVFIRAPRLLDLGPEVEVLVQVDGAPVMVRQGQILATTFHPELTDDLRVHRLLLELAARAGSH